jgi:hypothetical protein
MLKPTRIAALVAGACAFAGMMGTAHAFKIDTGNDDVTVNFDNQVRYNLGVRAEKINPAFGNAVSTDASEYFASRGDVLMNRLDLLSELDVSYKKKFGFRLSGAAWNDFAYNSGPKSNPALGAPSEYRNGEYNSYVKRFIKGPSGELLDAFVFANFDAGAVPVSVKAGKHTVYWGESLFTVFHGISYGQAPLDLLKATSSPGIEAKEVFMPINQLSGQAQLTNELSVAGQYFLDWKPARIPPGGTYFGVADATRADQVVVPTGIAAFPYTTFPVGPDIEPNRKRGNFGVNLRWAPAGANAQVGLYYRRFHEILPWAAVAINPASPLPSDLHLSFADDTKLYGVSLSTVVGTVSVGAEVSYRENAALNSATAFVNPATGNFDLAGREGARGNTWHALVNAIYILPKTALWEGGSMTGELVYSRLASVTKNPGLFKGVGYGGCPTGDMNDGCSTKDYWGIQVGFTPEWTGVLPSLDLSMPVSISYGLKGNAATLSAGNEGAATWSIGLGGKYLNQYEFKLAYNDSYTKYKTAGGIATTQNGSNAIANNHGWLSFTFKTSF